MFEQKKLNILNIPRNKNHKVLINNISKIEILKIYYLIKLKNDKLNFRIYWIKL